LLVLRRPVPFGVLQRHHFVGADRVLFVVLRVVAPVHPVPVPVRHFRLRRGGGGGRRRRRRDRCGAAVFLATGSVRRAVVTLVVVSVVFRHHHRHGILYPAHTKCIM